MVNSSAQFNFTVSNKVEVSKLIGLFNNKDQIYKYLWLLAILDKINNGYSECTYNDIVDYMVLKSWYMTLEYHIKLGDGSRLQELIEKLCEEKSLNSKSENTEILSALETSELNIVKSCKNDLINNVPYRFQSSFESVERIIDNNNRRWGDNEKKQYIELINSDSNAFYHYKEYAGINTIIVFNDKWVEYFSINMKLVETFTKYKMINYLQGKNPLLPGLIFKLEKPQRRDIVDVDDLWNELINTKSYIEGIDYEVFNKDIYRGDDLKNEKITTDHFVPFSYVANDEFYNLTPLSQRLNSSKSNKLYRDFDEAFFKLFAQQIQIYRLRHSGENKIAHKIKDCLDKHLNSDDMIKLYNTKNSDDCIWNMLHEKIKYDYDNAYFQGFEIWSVA